MATLALAGVALAGLFLAGLGVVALWQPARAEAFLSGFAQTPGRHWLELVVRALVGAALVVAAPRLPGALAFQWAGAVLLVTTVVLALVPWRWHARFASLSVPRAARRLPLVALASLAGGAALLVAVVAALAGEG